jgi:hypothetical protein
MSISFEHSPLKLFRIVKMPGIPVWLTESAEDEERCLAWESCLSSISQRLT